MKVKVLFAILLILISSMFCSCTSKIQDNTNDAGIAISSPKNTTKASPTLYNKIDNTNDESNQSLTSIDFKKYLNQTRSEYIKMLGSNYNPDDDYGTLSIPESHMNFPYLFLEDVGITLIFPTKKDNETPIYIVVNKESNKKNINYKGAKPGMTFMDIANNVANGTQSKSWVGTEDDVVYKLEYQEDGLNYCFVSYEESGSTFELYISKVND